MKRVLIISTSPRKGGISDSLAHEFERGAREAGHQVEYVSLADKTINSDPLRYEKRKWQCSRTAV